jgi:hypothetical protein
MGTATTTDDGYDVEPLRHVAQRISVAVGIDDAHRLSLRSTTFEPIVARNNCFAKNVPAPILNPRIA